MTTNAQRIEVCNEQIEYYRKEAAQHSQQLESALECLRFAERCKREYEEEIKKGTP
jgi:hypothetical protein